MGSFDDLIPGGSSQGGSGAFDDLIPKKSSLARRVLGDTGVSALKGAVGLTEVPVGIADILTGGNAGKALEGIGYRPKEAKAALDEYFSPEQKAANQYVQEGDGFLDTVKRGLSRPSVIAQSVVESLPLLLPGAAAARGIGAATKVAPYIAGAAGEGLVGAGSAAEQLRQGSEDGTISGKQTLGALASGVGTAGFGALGGKLASSTIGKKLGISDIDTVLAGGASNPANVGLAKRALSGAVSEGVLEELPQSMWEQAAQNYATDKPLGEGVGQAGAIGLLAGTAMGGTFNAMQRGEQRKAVDDAKPVADEVAPVADGLTFQPGLIPGVDVGEQKQATIPASDMPVVDFQKSPVYGPAAPVSRADGMHGIDFTTEPKLQETGPMSSAVNVGVDSGATSLRPQGSFSDMSEFANLLGEEQQDVQSRRTGIAGRQALQREVALQDADQRVADQMAKEAAQRRRAVLDQVLSDPTTQNPADRFAAELQRQGFRDSTPTADELATVQRFNDIRAAEPAGHEIEPSLPNELDAEQLGIRSRKGSSGAQSSGRDKVAEVRQLVADGWKVSNKTLVSPTGKKRILNTAEHAAAKEATRERNLAAMASYRQSKADFGSSTGAAKPSINSGSFSKDAVSPESNPDRFGANSKLGAKHGNGVSTLGKHSKFTNINEPGSVEKGHSFRHESVGRKNSGDSIRMDIERIGDLLSSESFIKQGFDGINSEQLRVVKRLMLRAGKDRKILNSVIESIPIDVMNMLARKKISPDALFNNPSMLKNIFSSGELDNSIPLVVNPAVSVVRKLAEVITKEFSGNAPSDLVFVPGDFGAASAANDDRHNKSTVKKYSVYDAEAERKNKEAAQANDAQVESQPSAAPQDQGVEKKNSSTAGTKKQANDKEPWQMTRDEYVRGNGLELSPHAKLTGLKESPWQTDDVSRATMTHKFIHVKPAIDSGKNVPYEVLADYPDLQKSATQSDVEDYGKRVVRRNKPVSKWTAEEIQDRLDRADSGESPISDESRSQLQAALEPLVAANKEKEAKAAEQAERVKKMQAAKAANKDTFQIGESKDSLERVSVRDGVVHLGDYPATDYNSGDDITVPDGATKQQVLDALIAGEAVTKKAKVWGKNGPEQSVADRIAELQAERDAMSKSEQRAVEAIQYAMEVAAEEGVAEAEVMAELGVKNEEVGQAERSNQESQVGNDVGSKKPARSGNEERDGDVQGQEREVKQSKPDQIGDFGEKLGGAKKDRVPSFEKTLSDNDIATLPLSKIWPASEIDGIENKFAAAVSYAARNEIPAKPRVSYKVASWVEKVKMLRGLASKIVGIGEDKARELFDKVMQSSDFKSKIRLMEAIDRSQWSRIGKVGEYPNAYRYGEGGEKIISPSVIVEIDGKTQRFEGAKSISDAMDRINAALSGDAEAKKMQFEVRGRTGSFAINKKGDKEYRKLKTFSTTKEAFDFIKNNYDDLVSAWGGVKEIDNVTKADIRNSENRPRTGKDRRNGKDVTDKQFQDAFGFRGVEFGNWVQQGANAKERQGMLNQAFDAMHDLAEIIGIPPKAISLNGTLGLGFGSRGSGSASAHFEPGNLVINLTKTRGAGTLAHEWFHALDNYFARSRNNGNQKTMAEVGNSQDEYRRQNFVTYKPERLYVHKTQRSTPTSRADLERFRASNPNSGYFKEDNWQADPSHPEGVRIEVESAFSDLVNALNASPMARRARMIDKGPNGYWSRIIERGARSFENYVISKMMEGGYNNDYLANVREVQDFPRSKERYPYLLPEEVAPISEAFDALFSTIQTKETDKGVAMFSRDDVNASRGQGSGMAFRDLQAVVDRVSKGFNNLPKIHVLDSPRDLSDRRDNERTLKEQIEQAGAMDDVEGAHHNGEIYLFASGIASEERSEHVLATHEITHYGLRGTMGKGLDSALQNIWLYNKEVRAKAAVLRMQLGLTSNVSAVEEVLAEMKDSDLVKLKGWRKMVQAFRDWAHKAGFDRIAAKLDGMITNGMSDQEKADLFVANMVNSARDWVRNGKPQRGYDPGTSMLGDANFSAKGDTINVDGIDRPVTNSNGKPIAQTKEGLRNFWRWFGDSKVVDAEGKPLVVYHATQSGVQIDAFNRRYKPDVKMQDDSIDSIGTWFTDSTVRVNDYADGTVYPSYLKIDNPRKYQSFNDLRFDWKDSQLSGKRDAAWKKRKAQFDRNNHFGNSDEFIAELGYDNQDGVIINRNGDGEWKDQTAYLAIKPEQIKSATGNNGSFDASNPDIRFSRNKSASVDASITEIFDGLAGRGLKKVRAEERLAEHPQAESIRYVQDNILDILEELEGAGAIKINC